MPSAVSADGSDPSQIRFAHHNKELGMSSNEVMDIVQHQSGWIWMATRDGLNQFDAHETRVHRHDPLNYKSLSSNDLTCLALGPKGEIWVGTAGAGLNRFDPKTEESLRFTSRKDPSGTNRNQLPSGMISALAISTNKTTGSTQGASFLWVGTNRGLAVMDINSGKIRQLDGDLGISRISCISVFDENSIWVGTTKGGVYQWDAVESKFKLLLEKSSPITAIGRDTRLQVWIGTGGAGLFKWFNGQASQRVVEDIRDVTTIWSDNLGDLWVGTTQGLAKKNHVEDSFRIFKSIKGEEHSLCDNHVTEVFEDNARNMLWVATKGGGTSRFRLDRYWFPHYKFSDSGKGLPHPSIWSMADSADGVWIGTERGVVFWNEVQQQIQRNIPGLSETGMPYTISLLEDSNRNLWIGTKGEGLIRIEPEGTVTKFLAEENSPGSLGHNYISELFEDSQNRIWVGTYGKGIYQFIPGKDEFKKQQTDTPQSMEFVNRIREDDLNRIWAGTREGLFVLSTAAPSWTSFSAVIPGEDDLPAGEITAMLLTGNYIWLGTERNGLARINISTGDSAHYTEPEFDLPDNNIISLAQDQSGFLWITTPAGISRLDTVKNKFRNFTGDDGLLDDFRPNALARGQNNSLLYGGSNGFNRVDPKVLPVIVQPPSPMLTQFEYFGKTVNPKKGAILEKPIGSTSVLKIPFDKRNRFAFRFANIDYRFPNQGYFRYQLLPNDDPDHWHDADKYRRAAYQNLSVGTYEFRVQSSQDNKNWNENTASVKVKITPPWYDNWWFKITTTLSLLAAVFFGVRAIFHNRIRAIERREAEISAERDKAEVALARQLQHAVLLERTSRGLNQSGREDEIFSHPLKNLADHINVDHGLIYKTSGEDDEEVDTSLRQIAHYSAEGNPNLPEMPLDFLEESVQKALQSESSFAVKPSAAIDNFLESLDEKPNVESVVFVSTRYLNRPNGVILLFSNRAVDQWDEQEIKLINALSPQFGMSIAQMKLAAKEQHYLNHLEEARHQAEVANRAKSDFLAKMTHELRTPLNSIIGFTEILLEDEMLMPRQRELVDIVNNSGDHLLDVINDILDLSKIEAGKIERSDETFELVPLLKSVYEMLGMKAKAKKIGFEFAARSALPNTVLTDRSKIRQTLINLIGNAIKFTDQGAVTLSVSANATGEPFEVEGQMRRPVRLSFEIADTGKGISKEDLPKLFEKYGQTESGMRSSEGTGLGLPIARSFIQLMGGDIHVDSEWGRGTTFQFFIECDEVAGSKTGEEQIKLSEGKAQKINGILSESRNEPVRILIAEDQPNNRLLLKKILGRAGFEMREATNGQEAVEVTDDWQPHLILMDEDMPVMKGSEATREIISKSYSDEPVIVSLTAYALEQARQAALEAGCKDFLAKPFKAHEIFSVISRHLEIDYTFEDAA